MTKLSGGEALVKSLVREGVEVVFGLPGVQMYGIIAALRDEPSIRFIVTRHEQATTYMADGYARTTGKPGVALVVPGPGIYNAGGGLSTAFSRSSPVVLIAGQIPRRPPRGQRPERNHKSDHKVAETGIASPRGTRRHPRGVPAGTVRPAIASSLRTPTGNDGRTGRRDPT